MDSLNKPIEVLLIEDSSDDIFLMKEVLQDAKMHINLHVAENGEKGLDFVYKKNEFKNAPSPDLILLDLNLPKIDGREVLEKLKSDKKYKTIPVVVLTTSQSDEDINKAYLNNANSYITKPVDLNQFMKVVKTIEDFWLTIVKLPDKP